MVYMCKICYYNNVCARERKTNGKSQKRTLISKYCKHSYMPGAQFGAVLLVLIAIVYVNCVIYWKAKWISMFMAVKVWFVYEKLPTAFIDGKLLRFDIC